MTKKQKKIYEFLSDKQGYLKKASYKIQEVLESKWLVPVNLKDIDVVRKVIKERFKEPDSFEDKTIVVSSKDKISEDKAVELIELVESKTTKKPKIKRLFFDIETSPNVVFSWRIGYNLIVPHDNILKERAIISVSWKFAEENKVHALSWNEGDDKQLLIDFIKVLNTADEIIGHNSDKFDIKWLRTRCIFHGIEMFPDYTQLDTLKLAKQGFLFNSNKLDYIGSFLGVGKKMETGGFSLWKSIILDNDEKAMKKMVAYNKVDVIRLQQIYDKLNLYSKHKTHVGVLLGKSKCSCVNCGSENVSHKGKVVLASGVVKHRMQCNSCFKYYRISNTDYEKTNI